MMEVLLGMAYGPTRRSRPAPRAVKPCPLLELEHKSHGRRGGSCERKHLRHLQPQNFTRQTNEQTDGHSYHVKTMLLQRGLNKLHKNNQNITSRRRRAWGMGRRCNGRYRWWLAWWQGRNRRRRRTCSLALAVTFNGIKPSTLIKELHHKLWHILVFLQPFFSNACLLKQVS